MSIKNRFRDFALFMLFILIFSFPFILTAPTGQQYSEFLKYVTGHKCYLPKGITPFSPSALGWFFLNEPLKQCDNTDANFETTTLCAEIFENIINTTCSLDPRLPIPKVYYKLSSNVCGDLSGFDNNIPKTQKYFGHKLVDNTVCRAVCADQYEILCEVLLWSYQIRHHIETTINATEGQKKMQPDVNSVPENQNGLISNIIPPDEAENPQQSQNEMNPVGNLNAVSNSPVTSEASDTPHSDNNVQNDIAKAVFESQKRLIPHFAVQDEEGQSNRKVQVEEHIEMVSSANANFSSAVTNDKSSNVQVTEVTKSTNQLENESTQVSSKNDTAEHTVEETSENNQHIISNAKNSSEKNRVKDLLKSKLMGKLPQRSQNAVVQEISTVSPSPKTNDDNITSQVAANEKFPDLESNHLALKVNNLLQNNEITNDKEDSGNEHVHKSSETAKTGKNVDNVNSNIGKMVFPLDTVQNLEKGIALNSNSSSTASSTKVSKSSDQENGQELSEGQSKDTVLSSKTEIKSTVEIQGQGAIIVTSESSNLEATTLEATLEEMDDANELPPPVQEQDQYNGALSPSTEVKKTVAQDSFITSEKTAVFMDQQDDKLKQYDILMPRGGQVSEDIRRITPFAEEEDGHFFFYFLSVILILMIGYLVFHNKQKIIALIVEGRHERRRRSYGAGYKKLETK